MTRTGSSRQNRHYDEDEDDFTTCDWLQYTFVVVLGSILLLAATLIVLFWSFYFHRGYAWEDTEEKRFNAHPTLMIAGFITLSGFSMLLYRISRCCGYVYLKLFHTLFHALATPCIAFGFLAVYTSKSMPILPKKHFYSFHSWMGLLTMALFALQFVAGFFSFFVLLCCKGATSACRSVFAPVHASFGLIVFTLAVATCLTGLTENIFITLKDDYSALKEEAIVLNVLAMVLVALGILVSYTLQRDSLRSNKTKIVSERL